MRLPIPLSTYNEMLQWWESVHSNKGHVSCVKNPFRFSESAHNVFSIPYLQNTVKQKYVIFCRILPQDGRTRIPAGLPEFHVGKNSFHSNIWKVHIKKQLQAIGGGNAINSLRPAEHCSDCHHRIE